MLPTVNSSISQHRRSLRFTAKMEVVRIPPFETFYDEHKDPVFAHLRRLLGDGAEDAFQETFLRALRAYPELRHGRHLRAWVFTIATRVALDEARRTRPRGELPELAVEDGLPPHAELGPLTDHLPPKERAAVILRYGFDLTYADIAAALDSSEDAARQAASSGVRRLRERSKQS
jgi:RNA polymerase sigma-70 factor (ECF subfamily)